LSTLPEALVLFEVMLSCVLKCRAGTLYVGDKDFYSIPGAFVAGASLVKDAHEKSSRYSYGSGADGC
jgi:hypothetical protein